MFKKPVYISQMAPHTCEAISAIVEAQDKINTSRTRKRMLAGNGGTKPKGYINVTPMVGPVLDFWSEFGTRYPDLFLQEFGDDAETQDNADAKPMVHAMTNTFGNAPRAPRDAKPMAHADAWQKLFVLATIDKHWGVMNHKGLDNYFGNKSNQDIDKIHARVLQDLQKSKKIKDTIRKWLTKSLAIAHANALETNIPQPLMEQHKINPRGYV